MSFSLTNNSNYANIYGGTINGASIGSTAPSTGIFTQLTSQSSVLVNAAGSGNVIKVSGAAASSPVTITADTTSADTNVGITYASKGTGTHNFTTDSAALQFQVGSVPLAVNSLRVAGGIAGGDVLLLVQGSDTNTSMSLSARGQGRIRFFTRSYGSLALDVMDSGVANVNSVTVQGSPTGVAVLLAAQGTDTDVSFAIRPKGAGALMAALPDGGTGGGNARGANAVDWQTSRTSAAQVASGQGSAINGGGANTASAAWSCVTGGFDNNANQVYSRVGGKDAIARGYASDNFSAGQFAVQGDAQSGTYILRGRSTSGAAVRLTADGAAAGAANVCNLPNNTAWNLVGSSIIARDTTAGSVKSISVRLYGGAVARGANAASLSLSTINWDAQVTGGSSGTISNFSMTADTINGGINLTFTPPDTNTWDVVAVFRAVEVQ